MEHALAPLALCLLRRRNCHCQCSIASPTPDRPKHVQIARNADRSIAIEPLRAPGYAPPIANAPRRELAELRYSRLRKRKHHHGKRTLAADTLLPKATTWSSTLTGSPSPPSRSLTSPSSAPESATLVLSPRPLLVRFLVRGNSRGMWREWPGWRGCMADGGMEMRRAEEIV